MDHELIYKKLEEKTLNIKELINFIRKEARSILKRTKNRLNLMNRETTNGSS